MQPQEILAAFRALPDHRRHEAMRVACAYALERWERYALDGPITYTDGVVGLEHVVDMQLPMRAIAAVDRVLDGDVLDPNPIWREYLEPRSAMQDGDLDFPDGIAAAYNAIYNLFGTVFGRMHLYDDEIVIRQAASEPDVLAEWWTRVWDAWATRTELRYRPRELDDATAAALVDGDLSRAIAVCSPDTRLHGVLLALAGRDGNIHSASDSIVVSGNRYAFHHANRYIVRDFNGALVLDGRCDFDLRRIAFAPMRLVLAGDQSDSLGAYRTVIAGEPFTGADFDLRVWLRGARTIAAVSSRAEVIATNGRLYSASGSEQLTSAIDGAAFDETGAHLVTYAGSSFALWRDRKQVVGKQLASDITHAFIAGGRVVVVCRDAPAHIIRAENDDGAVETAPS